MALTEIGARLRLANAAGFKRDADKAGKALDRFGRDAKGADRKLTVMERTANRTRGAMKNLAKGAALGLAGAVGGGIAFLAQGVKGATDLNESMSKVNTVFGKSAATVVSFSDTAARSMGMTKSATLEAAGTFGNLFSALGIAQPAAADLSKGLVTLATDLGSFNNVDSEEALLALRSGLLGEAEPLRKFGVSLSAARIEAEALANGLVKPAKNMDAIKAAQVGVRAATEAATKASKKYGTSSTQAAQASVRVTRAEAGLKKAMQGTKVELTAAQKAQAAYSIIMKDTSVAQGDFKRTSGGLANQQKIMRAQFEDTRTKIGNGLLPVMTRLATWVNDEALPAFNKLAEEFRTNTGRGGELRDTLADMSEKLQVGYEKTKQVIDFVVKHKDAFVPIAAAVAGYAAAMKLASIWTGAMAALNLGKMATGIAGVGTASATAAPGVSAFGAAAARSAGPIGAMAAALVALDSAGKLGFSSFGKGGAVDKIIDKVRSGDYGGALKEAWGEGFIKDEWQTPKGERKVPQATPAVPIPNIPRPRPRSSGGVSDVLTSAPRTQSNLVVPVYLNGREVGRGVIEDFEDRVARR